LEKVADLVWNIEFPMIKVCAMMHRLGVYFDKDVRNILKKRYDIKYQQENAKLAAAVQSIMSEADNTAIAKSPFKTGKDFNEGSPKHVTYLLNSFLGCQVTSGDKATLKNLNLPVTDQILKVRALGKLLNSFIDTLPDMVGPDGRVHSTFKSVGASTGRFSSSDPNVQQIPSHALDIRHQFRATPAMEKLIDADYNDSSDSIQVSLCRWDSVTTEQGQVDVEDLTIGTKVKIFDNGKEVWKIVKQISNSSKDTTLRDVVL
jgi:DNA polymerase-1